MRYVNNIYFFYVLHLVQYCKKPPCAGCGFLNTDRVDLVVGTSNFNSGELASFSIGNGRLKISNTYNSDSEDIRTTVTSILGFDGKEVDVLNLVAKTHQIDGKVIANKKIRILSGNHTYDHKNFIIQSDNNAGNLTTFAIDISDEAGLQAGSIELITTAEDLGGIEVEGEITSSQDITIQTRKSVTVANLKAIGNIYIDASATVEIDVAIAQGDIAVNAGNDLINLGVINTNNLDATVGDRFSNNGNIRANNFNIKAGFSSVFPNLVADDFQNNGIINTYQLSIITNDDIDNNGTIQANNINVDVGDTFHNDGEISTSRLDAKIGDDFNNNGTVNSQDFIADVGDVFRNYEIIRINTLNFTVGDDLDNYGSIYVDDLDAMVDDKFYNASNASIRANDFNIRAGFSDTATDTVGDFFTDDDFGNDGIIIAGNLSIEVDGDIDNKGDIDADDLDIIAGDIFFNDDDASIRANDFNIRAGFSSLVVNTVYADFENDGDIDAGNLSIETNNDVYNNGNIDANNANIVAGDVFRNDGTIRISTLNLTVGDDLDNYGSIYVDDLDATVDDIFNNKSGASIRANDFNIRAGFSSLVVNTIDADFENDGDIDAGKLSIETNNDVDNNGNIDADNVSIVAGDVFRNDGTIRINTLKLTVGDDLDNYGSIYVDDLDAMVDDKFYNASNASIRANDFNIRAGFSDTATDLFGDNLLTDDDFENDGDIDAGNLSIETNDDVDNNGDIKSNNLTVNVGDAFSNDGSITYKTSKDTNEDPTVICYPFIGCTNNHIIQDSNLVLSSPTSPNVLTPSSPNILAPETPSISNYNHSLTLASLIPIDIPTFPENTKITTTTDIPSLSVSAPIDYIRFILDIENIKNITEKLFIENKIDNSKKFFLNFFNNYYYEIVKTANIISQSQFKEIIKKKIILDPRFLPTLIRALSEIKITPTVLKKVAETIGKKIVKTAAAKVTISVLGVTMVTPTVFSAILVGVSLYLIAQSFDDICKLKFANCFEVYKEIQKKI